MPEFNVVKVRTDWAQLVIEADTYEEAIKIAEDTPIEPNQVEFGAWEINKQLGGKLD